MPQIILVGPLLFYVPLSQKIIYASRPNLPPTGIPFPDKANKKPRKQRVPGLRVSLYRICNR